MAGIDPKLGSKVSTRTINWNDEVIKAWGSEFRTPDHDIYKFSGNNSKDSTDKGRTGLYGVVGENMIYLNNKYPDMRDGVLVNVDGVTPLGSLNTGKGQYDNVVADSLVSSSTSGSTPSTETDPYFNFVSLLSFPSGTTPTDVSQNAFVLTPTLTPIVSVSGTMGATFAYAPTDISNSRVLAPSNPLFLFTPPAVYTLEFSILVPSTFTTSSVIMGNYSSYVTINKTGATFSIAVNNWVPQTINGLAQGQWYDVALTNDGTIGRVFINGAVAAQSTFQYVGDGTPSQFGIIGAPRSPSLGAAGVRLANIRVTSGYARYGATYVPRTTPFPTSGP